MTEYSVSLMCVFSDIVWADTPEEAADIAQSRCMYDVDGEAHVRDLDTGEEFDV